MALRKLAGPFAIVDESGNQPSTLGGIGVAWVPYMGLAIRGGASGVAIGMLALDGVLEPFASTYYDGSWGWDAVNHVIIARGYPGPDYVLDPRSFVGYPVAGAPGSMGTFVQLADRRITVDGDAIVAIASDGTRTTEFSGTGFWPDSISAGRADDDFFITASSPASGYLRCRFYSSSKRNLSPMMYVPASSGGSNWVVRYAPELQIIVAVDCDNFEVSIWSIETLPASVTDAALFSGSVAKGNVAQFRCRVLGDQSEPCASELVDWSISGPGELLDQQSAADATGSALARVLYGISDSGDSTVMASVRC